MKPIALTPAGKRPVRPKADRPAWQAIAELLTLVPKRHHKRADRIARELFIRGQETTREIYAEVLS